MKSHALLFFLYLVGCEGNEIEMDSVVCLIIDTNKLKKCCVGGFCSNDSITGSSVDNGTHTHGKITICHKAAVL
jgi:hypothetical protein